MSGSSKMYERDCDGFNRIIEDLAERLRDVGYGVNIRVDYNIFYMLQQKGMLKRRIGECMLKGRESYEYTLPTGEALHFEVDQHNKRCWAHLDRRSPLIDPIGHLIQDAPHWLRLLVIIGLIGIVLYTSQENFRRSF